MSTNEPLTVMDAETVAALADPAELIDAILEMYRYGCAELDRLTLSQPTAGGDVADSLIQPGWMPGRALGVKIANVFYENPGRGLPTVMGGYLLFDGNTGAPLAYLDGVAETFVKTAANSGAASRLLSRPDSSTLLMLGAGRLAPHLIAAHIAARPITRVLIKNRTRATAERLAEQLQLPGVAIEVVDDTARAVGEADVISCATYANEPILRGEWLRPGCHVDLVGGYRPDQREADGAVVVAAGGVMFVDARETTVGVAGDLVGPMEEGVLRADGVIDLFELSSGAAEGRTAPTQITVFKSGGGGHEDLAVALALYLKSGGTLST